MTNFVATIIKVAIHRDTENPVFGESNTFISIDDEAAGPFIVIEQCNDYNNNKSIRVDFEELEAIFEASKMLMNQAHIIKAEAEAEAKSEESENIELGTIVPGYSSDYVI